MKTKSLLLLLTCVALAACCIGLATVFIYRKAHERRVPSHSSVSMVRSCVRWQVASSLQLAGYSNAYVVGIQRTSDAEGLVIRGGLTNELDEVNWIVQGGSIRCVRCPRGVPFADENGHLVAWFDATTIYFADGISLARGSDAKSVIVDVSGKYFVVATPRGTSWLGRVGDERNVLWSVNSFDCQGIRCLGSRIFLFGSSRPHTSHPMCVILLEDGGKFKIVRTVNIDYGRILDVDPTGEALLVLDSAGIFHSLYVYNILSGKKSKCGNPAEDLCTFLRTDLFASPNPLVRLSDNTPTNRTSIEGTIKEHETHE